MIEPMPVVNVLSGFDEQVEQEALRRMDQAKRTVPYRNMIVAPDQEPGRDVPYLNHATGTKEGWGGPATSRTARTSRRSPTTPARPWTAHRARTSW